ncbi:hypothetical protein KAW48_07995 [candidate division WOR-3 bacterium]|nr:hypothetical protein [candidate division WOR-3 bacterium]
MRFSERYGYKKIEEYQLLEEIPNYLKTRIWNILRRCIFREKRYEEFPVDLFIIDLWDKFFKEDLDKLVDREVYTTLKKDKVTKIIKNLFLNLQWFEVYDLVEFLISEFPNTNEIPHIVKDLNNLFEEESVPYRIVGTTVSPLTNKEEIKEIEKAINPPDKFAPVRHHLEKALERFSDKKEPDYHNSIKESILAVESLAQIITGKDKALSGLIQSLKNVHYNLREGFKELYNWTSKEGGIRHAKSGKTLEPGIAEARYMLVTVSAFINYVITKYNKDEIEENEEA